MDRKEHLKVHIQNKHTYYCDEGEYDTTLKEAMDRHRTTVHKMNVSRGDKKMIRRHIVITGTIKDIVKMRKTASLCIKKALIANGKIVAQHICVDFIMRIFTQRVSKRNGSSK